MCDEVSFNFDDLVNFFLQIDHVFLSRVCSETAGGLPGLVPAVTFLFVA